MAEGTTADVVILKHKEKEMQYTDLAEHTPLPDIRYLFHR